jgi:undecaprenyl-diphosphatase
MIRRLTHLGGARATILAGLVLVAVGGEERRVGVAALLANALSHLAVQILKRAVARARPCDSSGRSIALIEPPDPFSFPSGHSAAAFAVAVPIAATHPWLGPAVLAVAGLVAYSRVALRVHHTIDVLAGAAIGVAGAIVALRLLL